MTVLGQAQLQLLSMLLACTALYVCITGTLIEHVMCNSMPKHNYCFSKSHKPCNCCTSFDDCYKIIRVIEVYVLS
jgi:hypothetical protein